MKKIIYFIVISLLLVACTHQKEANDNKCFINSNGKTLATRICVPDGYHRNDEENTTLTSYLRNFDLKEADANVYLYNGKKKKNQSSHVAVMDLPLENKNLQQCADSIMRIYAQYFYETKQYERISFHFVNGFEAKYTQWREGYSIKVNGNNVSWYKSEENHQTDESFVDYLHMVFMYASTLSLDQESISINIEDINVGDIFIHPGSPGHAVMVVDVCINENGDKAFLLAQGYMPAQQFEILKNPLHQDDPWYYTKEFSYPLKTPEYTFEKGSLKRPIYEKT